jgi:hypothetical protein
MKSFFRIPLAIFVVLLLSFASLPFWAATQRRIPTNAKAIPCSGPLSSACDPVTGVIPDPRNKDCILAAAGLVHMFSHGRILRVCGKDASLIFEKSHILDGLNGHELKVTEAFFGLTLAADGGFWALTSETLYHFGADGTENEEYQLPELKPVSGIYLGRELPGVIVVRTDTNWAVSVSGYTPILIPLKGAGL